LEVVTVVDKEIQVIRISMPVIDSAQGGSTGQIKRCVATLNDARYSILKRI
jgi:hypothetical protein